MPVTRPSLFENGEEMMELFREFCRLIADGGFEETPTDTEFVEWLYVKYRRQIDRRTINQALTRLIPAIQREFEAVRADVIVHGAMVKVYQPQAALLALKNLCGWTDKQEVKTTADINMANAIAEVEALVSMR